MSENKKTIELQEVSVEDLPSDYYAEIPEKSDDDLLRALLDTEDVQTKDVYLTRFGANFRVQSISSEAYSKLEKRCRYPIMDKRTHEMKEKVDQDKLSVMLVAEACIRPDFSHPKLLEKYQTKDPLTVIKKRLLIGEVNILSEAIMEVSGFDFGPNEVKN